MTHQLFSVVPGGNGTTLKIRVDRVDMSIADELKDGIWSVLQTSKGPVTIDMEAVSFVDSSGLGALVSVRKKLGEARELRLKNNSDFLDNVLKMTKLAPLFQT